METNPAPFEIVDFAALPGLPCPCGTARRGLMETKDFPGSIHVTEISIDAKKHYHRDHSEVYYILECEENAQIELNEDFIAVHPGFCVLIRPGTFHRAIGKMKVLILSTPKFDPQDEYFAD